MSYPSLRDGNVFEGKGVSEALRLITVVTKTFTPFNAPRIFAPFFIFHVYCFPSDELVIAIIVRESVCLFQIYCYDMIVGLDSSLIWSHFCSSLVLYYVLLQS